MGEPVAVTSAADRWPPERLVLWLAAVVAPVPFAVAAGRAVARGWYPTGDVGIVAFRAQDVFSRNPPLLGTWSSASLWARVWINHPGALQFDLLAVPVRLLGVGPGVAVGTAAVNVAALWVAGWLVRRRAGPLAGAVFLVLVGTLVWSMGSELLYDAWSQFAPLLPFLCFLVAVWSVADGDLVALPIAAFAGSFLFQTHLSYVLLVPGLGVGALGALVVEARRRRRADPGRWSAERRRLLGWSGATVAVLLASWAQPLYEQLSRAQGNLSSLVTAAGRTPPTTPGAGGALQAVGDVVALPPWWLPPSWQHPGFEPDGSGRPVVLVAAALTALVAGLVVLLVSAARRRDRTTRALLGTTVLTLVLGFVGVAKSNSPLGLDAAYVRWLWPIALLTWFALGWGLLRVPAVAERAERRRPSSGARPVSRPLAGPALATGVVAVLVAALASVPADHGASSSAWAPPVAEAVTRDALPVLEHGSGPLLVQMRGGEGVYQVGPAVLSMLRSHGVTVVVDDEPLVRQLGEARRYRGGSGRVLVVSSGLGVVDGPAPGARRLAVHVGLDRGERMALADLERRLLTRLRRAGGLHPSDSLAKLHGSSRTDVERILDRSRTDPAAVLHDGSLILPEALSHFLDLAALGRADVDRFLSLQRRLQDRSVALDLRTV